MGWTGRCAPRPPHPVVPTVAPSTPLDPDAPANAQTTDSDSQTPPHRPHISAPHPVHPTKTPVHPPARQSRGILVTGWGGRERSDRPPHPVNPPRSSPSYDDVNSIRLHHRKTFKTRPSSSEPEGHDAYGSAAARPPHKNPPPRSSLPRVGLTGSWAATGWGDERGGLTGWGGRGAEQRPGGVDGSWAATRPPHKNTPVHVFAVDG